MKRRIVIILVALILAVSAAGVSFFAVGAMIDGYAERYAVTPPDAPLCDAVMVLGAFVRGETPSPVLQDRLDYGYELYAAGKAKKILLSGDHGTKGYDEVNAMKSYMLSKGVPPEDIFLDHAGFNTYDSMYRARDIFQIRTLLISTQRFHMGRSVYIARKLGLEAYGYASEDKAIYNMSYLNLRESFARLKAFWDAAIIRRKPKLLGDVIPIDGDGALTAGMIKAPRL